MRTISTWLSVFLSLSILGLPAHATSKASSKALIDPSITFVSVGHGDKDRSWFPRVILRNTEDDQCPTLERVTLRDRAKVLASERLCKYRSEDGILSLEETQDVTFEKIVWKGNRLLFNLDLVRAEPRSLRLFYSCSVDASLKNTLIVCDRLLNEARDLGSTLK